MKEQIDDAKSMSFRNFFATMSAALFLVVAGFLFATPPSVAANATARDANSIELGDVIYRLDGVDAPELDQICINNHADPWACGLDARDQLTKLIAGRSVHCDDVGPEKSFGRRHRAICTADGDKASLNEQLVRLGFAIAREPAKANIRSAVSEARSTSRGIWEGCFVAPREFRIGRKDGTLLGASCRVDRDREIRGVLFPQELPMPPGCDIKGRFAMRARITGNIGIYHLRGCPSYAATTWPDRWFCSEGDAQAAGFRKAYNCRRPK